MSQRIKSSSSLNDDVQNMISSSEQKVKCPGTEEPKLSPIDRFRRIARSVQSQSRWTKALQTKIAGEHSKEFQITQKSGDSNLILSFNANGEQIFQFCCFQGTRCKAFLTIL